MPSHFVAATLHAAAESGDLFAVRAELAKRKDQRSAPDQRTAGYNETALHRAAVKGHMDVVNELLAAGADINAVRSGGFTPLHLAETVSVAEALLKGGAALLRSSAGKTAAEHCAGGTPVQQFIADYAAAAGMSSPAPPIAQLDESLDPPPPPPQPEPEPASEPAPVLAAVGGADTFIEERRASIADLEKRKATAAAAERYEEAGELKNQIQTLTAEMAEHLATAKFFSESDTKGDAEQLKKQGNAKFKKKDWAGAIEKYSEAIAIEGSVPAYLTNRAVALTKLGRYAEAKADGLAAAELAPAEGFAKGYLKAAQACGWMDDYQGMCELLEDAMAETICDPSIKLTLDTAALNCEAADCALRCNEYASAIEEAAKALAKDPNDPLAHVITADALAAQYDFTAAMKTYEMGMMAGMRSGNTDESLQQRTAAGIGKCQQELSKGRKPQMPGGGKDLYSALGLQVDASESEIKKAYHKMALAHHPDKHAGGGEEAVAAAEQKFKEVGEAYAVLSDADQKKKYDQKGLGAINWADLFPKGGGIDANEVWEIFTKQTGMGKGLSGPEGVSVAVPEDILTEGFMSNMTSGGATATGSEARGRIR